jgi:hypothetical protein
VLDASGHTCQSCRQENRNPWNKGGKQNSKAKEVPPELIFFGPVW